VDATVMERMGLWGCAGTFPEKRKSGGREWQFQRL
jgi:hypothetical protein